MSESWVQIVFTLPDDELDRVLAFARSLSFVDVDWCVMQRENDFARVDYDPCAPRRESGYAIDPFGRNNK